MAAILSPRPQVLAGALCKIDGAIQHSINDVAYQHYTRSSRVMFDGSKSW